MYESDDERFARAAERAAERLAADKAKHDSKRLKRDAIAAATVTRMEAEEEVNSAFARAAAVGQCGGTESSAQRTLWASRHCLTG